MKIDKLIPVAEGDLLPALPVASLLAHYGALPMVEGAPSMATWPLTTDEGLARLHQTLEGPSIVVWFETAGGRTLEFPCTDIAVAWREGDEPGEDGEIPQGPALSLTGPQGVYAIGTSASRWVYRALQRLAAMPGIGPPPWNPPVILRAQRAITSTNRERLAVVYVGRARVES